MTVHNWYVYPIVMSILESKTRVTFVTEKENLEHLKAIVEARKRGGLKATVSSLLDELVSSHVEACDLFRAIPAASLNEG